MGTCGEFRSVFPGRGMRGVHGVRSGRGVVAALGLAVLLAGTPACSSGDGDRADDERPPTRTAAPTGEPVRDRACEVELPGGWSDALADGQVDVPDGERAVLTEVGPGAAWTVLQSTQGSPAEPAEPSGPSGPGESPGAGGGQREIVLREGEGEPRPVMELADPVEHQLGSADFDGRWLAFDVVEGRQLESPWKLYAWDATSGRRELVAEAELEDDGKTAVPGPFVQAVVRSGRLFWAQGTGGGKSSVYARDLAEGGERRTVYEGVVDTPFAAGGLLVWLRQGQSEGRPETRLAAVSMDTLEPAELPGPIARLRDIRYVASDGRTWAWAGGDVERPRLYVWREGWRKPLALLRGPGGGGGDGGAVQEPELGGIDQVQVSGDVVTWRTTEAAWALDLRSRSYARITPRYGYALARDGGLGVAYPEGEAKDPATTDVIQVTRASTLPPLPSCD